MSSASFPAAMFSLDQGMMGGRNDNSSDPQRAKRPLSVIEEHLDEDVTGTLHHVTRIPQRLPPCGEDGICTSNVSGLGDVSWTRNVPRLHDVSIVGDVNRTAAVASEVDVSSAGDVKCVDDVSSVNNVSRVSDVRLGDIGCVGGVSRVTDVRSVCDVSSIHDVSRVNDLSKSGEWLASWMTERMLSGGETETGSVKTETGSVKTETGSVKTETGSVKKTRKKAISTPLSPLFLSPASNNDNNNNNNNHNNDDDDDDDDEHDSVDLWNHSVQQPCQHQPRLQQRHSLPEQPHPRREPTWEGDLTRLKDTATKLNLKTRRQSYLTWRAQYVDGPRERSEVKVTCGGEGRLTQERKNRIDSDLRWIKGQLIDLRRQDQSLARQLLGIRHELSNLRLAASCEEHRDLLEDAQDQMDELRELSRFVDFPPEMLGSSPLRQIGVTKMNLSSRRFSTC